MVRSISGAKSTYTCRDKIQDITDSGERKIIENNHNLFKMGLTDGKYQYLGLSNLGD